ncbi:hypothetical protein BC835DRAFT_1309413 [Cytidiella melzeri]|nr:hypothetical protein BC835DRAFT_1309413 [Cytidiella melzeri]
MAMAKSKCYFLPARDGARHTDGRAPSSQAPAHRITLAKWGLPSLGPRAQSGVSSQIWKHTAEHRRVPVKWAGNSLFATIPFPLDDLHDGTRQSQRLTARRPTLLAQRTSSDPEATCLVHPSPSNLSIPANLIMTTFPSPSFSGPSSPRSPTQPSRSDSKLRLSRTPRSPRASPHSRSASSSTSEQGYRVRRDAHLETDPLFSDAASSSRNGGSPKFRLPPICTEYVDARKSKVRSISAIHSPSRSSSSCSETPETTSLRQEAALTRCPQAHQRPYDLPSLARYPARAGKDIQVPLSSPVSPLSSFPPFSLTSPSRSQPPRTPDRRTAVLLTPQTSSSSLESGSSSPRVRAQTVGFSTPSPSPQARKFSNSSTPSRRAPSNILIRQALVPARGPPTLAMSMQIHAPSPIISSRPTSLPTNKRRDSRSHSRPPSPLSLTTNLPLTRPGMPRPPSRSERLLRDTLRKVEEHERMMMITTLPTPSVFGAQQPAHGFMTPPPPGGRRSRRATSSSTTTDASLDAFAYCDTGACYSDEEDAYDDLSGARWLKRSSSRSSSSSGHGFSVPPHQSPRPQLPVSRHYSDDHVTRQRDDVDGSMYASPSSPSPARAQLQRSARSVPGATRPTHASPQSASRSSTDAGRGVPIQAPHSVVLHSRLEGVLKGAKDVERAKSRERDYSGASGGSNSMTSSRNMSVEGEWFFAPGEASSPTSNGMDSPSQTKSRSRANTTSNQPLRSPRLPNAQLPGNIKVSSHQLIDPLTPPPTPPFNALTASAQCKAMHGYVSFANIEGLGVPGGQDDHDDDDEAKRSGRWMKWFHVGQTKPERDRSISVAAR